MRGLLALAVALFGIGCSPGFDPSSFLKPGKLRVLGVVAEPPEVPAGGTSMLTVISPPMTDGTLTTFQWAVCTQPPPPGTADVDNDCLIDDTASFLIPVDSTGASAMVTFPASEGPATLGVPDISGGFYLPVRIRAFAGTQRVDTIYGLRLSLPELPTNHNPTIDHTELVDAPLDASPMLVTELSTDPDPKNRTPVQAGTEPVLRLLLTADSYEQFPELTGTPPNQQITTKTEDPSFFWYASAGELTEDTTGMAEPDTKLRLDHDRAPSVGDLIDLWVVVHDDRGGTAVTTRYLIVQ